MRLRLHVTMKSALSLATFALVLTATTLASAQNAGPVDLHTTKDVLIKFVHTPNADLVRRHGGAVKRVLSFVNGVSATIPTAAWDALARNPNVSLIEADGVAYASKPGSRPGGQGKGGKPPAQTIYDAPQQTPWGVTRIDALASGSTGTDVRIAVIDSGIGPNADVLVAGGYDFVNNDAEPLDDNGHGTHVAGTIAALNNSIGVIGGAPDALIYAVKVLNRRGSGSYSDIIAGIEWCIANDMQVINMSLGGESDSQLFHDAIAAANDAGILVVVAAGNDATSGNNVQYPAAYDEVLAVAATDVNNEIGYFSSHGYWVDIAAPGVSVLSTIPNDGLDSFNGTSMAAPHVAAAAALVLANDPTLTNTDLRARLLATATDLGSAGWDEFFGQGLVDANAAVNPPAPLAHDVALTSVVAPAQVNLNETFNVTVNVVNNGTNDETVTVSLASSAGTSYEQVFVAAGASATVSFGATAGTAGTETFTATASIASDENPANDLATATTEVIDPNDVTTIHVGTIAYRLSGKKGRDLVVEVSVVDASSGAIAGASVSVTLNLNGTPVGTGSATTGANGVASFRLRNAPSGTYTTTIDGVVGANGETYNAAANVSDPSFTK